MIFLNGMCNVTYWGMTEPVDSTKTRLRAAVKGIKDYDNHLEGMKVKVYGDGAYAFFILRQTYALNGVLMDEYLPTTFDFKSAGGTGGVSCIHTVRQIFRPSSN